MLIRKIDNKIKPEYIMDDVVFNKISNDKETSNPKISNVMHI